jgi:outer membrane protein assembly factor BamD
MHRFRRLRPTVAGVAIALVALLAACGQPFRLRDYEGSDTRLFQATMREYERGRYENAILGFERLTLDLPARDTLLPRAHFYLGRSHYKQKQYLLAAQAFSRLAESFATDTLADDALLWTARAYRRLWRKPTLDAEYGRTSLTTYQLLTTLYPDSPLRADAERQIADLQNWLARKALQNGMHYLRRKAYDSAIIYFRDVLQQYPSTPTAREASLRLVQAYRAIRYTEDARELCESLRRDHSGDADVREACDGLPAAAPAGVSADTARATPSAAPSTTSDSASAPDPRGAR